MDGQDHAVTTLNILSVGDAIAVQDNLNFIGTGAGSTQNTKLPRPLAPHQYGSETHPGEY